MPKWTCPNTRCAYDKQLQPGQHCPLCGKEAKEFNFSEFGDLLKKKWGFKKSIERTKKHEQVLGRVKFCPKCGSTRIYWARGLPQLWSIWECLDCGYKGAFIIEGSKLAEKIQEHYRKTREEKQKPSS